LDCCCCENATQGTILPMVPRFSFRIPLGTLASPIGFVRSASLGLYLTFKSRLLCTTILTGALLAFSLKVRAADATMPTKAPPTTPAWVAPAVDGFNWKVGGLGGTLANRTIAGGQGSFSIPVGNAYGFQLDGASGSFDNRYFGAVAGHLFWRDPSRGLLGIYGSHTYWDQFGGLSVNHVAGEGEAYLGPFTVQGIAGAEFGNSRTNVTGVSTSPAATTTFTETYDGRTRFFDEINLAWYANDNTKLFVGHRYLGGKNALALGGEAALPSASPYLITAFVEGRVGEANYHGIWGGLRFYWDQKSKSLIQRQRQDDPNNWLPETLFSITNALSGSATTVTTPDGDADGEGDGDF
jgi:hypothetical protein